MTHFLAVDAGGTRTRVLSFAPASGFMGRGKAGSGRFLRGREGDLVATLRSAIRQALDHAGHSPARARCAVLHVACAGLAEDSERQGLENFLRSDGLIEELGRPQLQLESDLEAAWRGSLGGRDGIVLIAGTGSVAFGRHGEDQARSGGQGSRLGDEGSAYDLARRSIVAALRADDGRGPATILASGLDEHFQRSRRALVLAVEHGDLDRSAIASFAPRVLEAAEAEDDAARAIAVGGAEELSLMAQAVGRRLGEPRLPVALTGGVLEASPFYRALVATSLRGHGDHPTTEAKFSPLVGAMMGALAGGGLQVDDATLVRLASLD